MSKVLHIAQGSPIPEWFLDAFQEFTSTMASANFAITQLNATTLQIVAGADSAQVAVGIPFAASGAWRYITASITASVPGGLAAGTHDIYVTAFANGPYTGNPIPPPNVIDSTNYAFALKLVQAGTFPSGSGAEAMYRLVGHFTWDGASITDVRVTVGGSALIKHAASHLGAGGDAIDWGGTVHAAGTLAARPAYVATSHGYIYWATDVQILYRNSLASGAWVQVAPAVLHEATHLPGGTDPLPWTSVNAQGTLASRPAAASTNAGFSYLATDAAGGTEYVSTGSAWTQSGAGVTHAANHLPNGSDGMAWGTVHAFGTLAARPSASATNTNLYYYASDVNGGTLYQNQSLAWVQITQAGSGIATAILLSGTLAARPAAAAGNSGFYYFATDSSGGTIFQSNGASWTQLTPGMLHASRHAPGGADALDYTLVNLIGVAGSRPAAASSNNGLRYFATDTGEWSQSNGASWTQLIRPLLSYAQLQALTPYNGMEVYMQADSANGINWHVRYNASSASAYKWEVLSGPPLLANATTITLPTNGDYEGEVNVTYIGGNNGYSATVFAATSGTITGHTGAGAGGSTSAGGTTVIGADVIGVFKVAGVSSGCVLSHSAAGSGNSVSGEIYRFRPIRIS